MEIGTLITSLIVGIVVATTAAYIANRYAARRDRRNYLYDQRKNAYVKAMQAYDFLLLESDTMEQRQINRREVARALVEVRFFGSYEMDVQMHELFADVANHLIEGSDKESEDAFVTRLHNLESDCRLELGMTDKENKSEQVFWKRGRTPRPLHPFAPKGSEKSPNH